MYRSIQKHGVAEMFFAKPKLIEKEKIIYKKGSNFIASVDEADLVRFCADQLMWIVGMQGKEAIGGHLYITNFRLIFVAHSVNRLKGQFSIPLSAVNSARRQVKFPVFKLVVETSSGRYDFVNWNVRDALSAIASYEDEAPPELETDMLETLTKNQPLCFVNALFVPKDAVKHFWNKRMSE